MSNIKNSQCNKCVCCLNKEITGLNKENTNLIKELTETKKLYESTKKLLESVIRKNIFPVFYPFENNDTAFSNLIKYVTKYMLTINNVKSNSFDYIIKKLELCNFVLKENNKKSIKVKPSRYLCLNDNALLAVQLFNEGNTIMRKNNKSYNDYYNIKKKNNGRHYFTIKSI